MGKNSIDTIFFGGVLTCNLSFNFTYATVRPYESKRHLCALDTFLGSIGWVLARCRPDVERARVEAVATMMIFVNIIAMCMAIIPVPKLFNVGGRIDYTWSLRGLLEILGLHFLALVHGCWLAELHR